MPDIVMQDLYGQEQVYENVTELSLKKTDGGTEWFIERPVDHFVLRETDYEPSGASAIATGGVGPMFGGGEINLLMMAYAPVEGVSEHAVIAMAHELDKVRTGYYYVYESLTGAELLTVMGGEGAYAGTAQPGWNVLENVDGVDTLRHIDDPESVSIAIPRPYNVIDEAAFYSLLSPVGQENKAVTLTANGTVEIRPEPGSSGLRSVRVTVDVEGGGAKVESDILPLITIAGFTYIESYGLYMMGVEASYSLNVGEIYRVVWDGTVYECAAQDTGSMTEGSITLGNGAAWGFSGNDEPFVITLFPGDGYASYMSLTDTEDGGSHTVRIYQMVEGASPEGSGAAWKSWQLINGQCALTAEDYETYFTAEESAAMLVLFDAAPLGISAKLTLPRVIHSVEEDGIATLCFSCPPGCLTVSTGKLEIYTTHSYVTIRVEKEDDGYVMRLLYLQMEGEDLTAYITDSDVPQTIYAIPSPFAE